jgi:hypothetical protein
MKSCPTCNRTFEDTFTFCLIDGSILSAPYDPQATLIDSANNSQPTVALPTSKPAGTSTQMPQPAATVPMFSAEERYSNRTQSTSLIEPAARIKFLSLYTLLNLLYMIAALILWYLLNPHLPRDGQSEVSYWSLSLIRAVLLGIILGGFQSLMLRKYIRSITPWVLATITGHVTGMFVRLCIYQLIRPWMSTYNDLALAISEVYRFVVPLVGLTCIVVAQWLVLRRYASSAWLWVMVSLLAGVIEYAIQRAGDFVGIGGNSILSISLDLFAGGILFGIIQGLCLIFLRRKQVLPAAHLVGQYVQVGNN